MGATWVKLQPLYRITSPAAYIGLIGKQVMQPGCTEGTKAFGKGVGLDALPTHLSVCCIFGLSGMRGVNYSTDSSSAYGLQKYVALTIVILFGGLVCFKCTSNYNFDVFFTD